MITITEDVILSIIIPVYNAEKYLPRLIESLPDEIPPFMEIFFVDDGSEDCSVSLLKKQFSTSDNVYIDVQKHSGACAARNLGLSKAKGNYIYFFDSDDYFTDDIFDKLLPYLQNADFDILLGNAYTVDEKGVILSEKFQGITTQKIYQSDKNLFLIDSNPGNKIFKKEIIDTYNVAFDDVSIHQDLNFYLKFIPFCTKIQYVSDYMYYYVLHNDSISHTVSSRIAGVVDSMEGIFNFYQKYKLFPQLEKEYQYNYIKHILFQVDKLAQMVSIKQEREIALLFMKKLEELCYQDNPYIQPGQITRINNFLNQKEQYLQTNDEEIIKNKLNGYQAMKERGDEYNRILSQWLLLHIHGHSVENYFKRNALHSVAIYGTGSLGNLLREELKDSDIQVLFLVDQSAGETSFGSDSLPVIKPEKIASMPETDAIIVTPVHVYDGIRQSLQNYSDQLHIISLEDIVFDTEV